MEKSDPAIALVVCTRNRANRLDPFLDSIRKLRCDLPWELLIVNNGSTDNTREYLEKFASTFSGRISILNEPKPGLGRARNRGWRETKAPIIAFTDDDCYPEPNFLNDLQAVFADPKIGFAGGRILLFDSTDARITIYERESEQTFHPGDFIVGGVVQGANMSFRRTTLEEIEGFDDHLGAGTPFAFEDVDAELRALAAGWTGKHDPRTVIYHHHGRKPGPDVDAIIRSYDIGRGGYFGKCLLHLPQRKACLMFWLRGIKRQPLRQTWREVSAAIRYFFYQLRQKPNLAY